MINLLSRNIWEWRITRNLMLSAVHVSGIHNETADLNSRNFNDRTEWSLHPTVFKWLSQATFDPDIDLFASRLNAKVPRFVSWSPDPSAFACDAFSLIWKEFNVYAFPPFSLISRVVVHLKRRQGPTCVTHNPSVAFPVMVSHSPGNGYSSSVATFRCYHC